MQPKINIVIVTKIKLHGLGNMITKKKKMLSEISTQIFCNTPYFEVLKSLLQICCSICALEKVLSAHLQHDA
jgi:hypothetical protein